MTNSEHELEFTFAKKLTLYYLKDELHGNQKYTGDVAHHEYGINVCDLLTIVC